MEDIHDIKGLVPVPQSLWWLLTLLAVAVIGVVAWLLWRRRKPAANVTVAPPPLPNEVALQALRRLWEEQPDVEVFYTRISDIVRHYLEGRFLLHAPDRTTEEFLSEVSRDHTLSEDHQRLLAEFLQESDLVKFAKVRPGQPDMKRAYDAAENFVRDTQPQMPEPATVKQS